MEGVGQAGEERFLHPRGRPEPVKEKQGMRIRAAGFAVEDRQPVHINRFIGRRLHAGLLPTCGFQRTYHTSAGPLCKPRSPGPALRELALNRIRSKQSQHRTE